MSTTTTAAAAAFTTEETIEDAESWRLHQAARQEKSVLSPLPCPRQHHPSPRAPTPQQQHLQSTYDQAQEQQQQRRLHYYTRDERPPIQYDTQHALMIDAGSQGTRIHVYEFEARILSTRRELKDALTGRRLSFPTTDSRWTNRKKPGLDVFGYVRNVTEMQQQVRFYLQPLLQFAKDVLAEKRDHWAEYPIYLKATGGLRILPAPYRLALLQQVRSLFSNDHDFNPFFFATEHARVISGEEEAIYGWTAVNFVHQALLPFSAGTGSVLNPGRTYGVLEMGGASTQIAFFQPNGDVMANLFKLQIGSSKHWNVYAHSFLYFGVNGAFARHNARLIAEAAYHRNQSDLSTLGVYNPCLPGGSHYIFTSRVRMLPDGSLVPLSSRQDRSVIEAQMYAAPMINDQAVGNYEECAATVHKLLRKEANQWCDFAHDRDCSLAGIYQPPLPLGSQDFKEFIVTSNFVDVFQFLQLPGTSSLASVQEGARRICTMSLFALEVYNSQLAAPVSSVDDLVQYCFRATFVASFLIEGIGFPESLNVTAIDVINGQKLGWALGSTLYEINTLPWEFEGALLSRTSNASDANNDRATSKKSNGTISGNVSTPQLLVDMTGKLRERIDATLLMRVFRGHHREMTMSAMAICLVIVMVIGTWTRLRKRRPLAARRIPMAKKDILVDSTWQTRYGAVE